MGIVKKEPQVICGTTFSWDQVTGKEPISASASDDLRKANMIKPVEHIPVALDVRGRSIEKQAIIKAALQAPGLTMLLSTKNDKETIAFYKELFSGMLAAFDAHE